MYLGQSGQFGEELLFVRFAQLTVVLVEEVQVDFVCFITH